MLGLKLDQHIKVAVNRRVPVERGPKQGQAAYVMPATWCLSSARNRVFCSLGGGHLSSLSLTQVARCCTATEKPGFCPTLPYSSSTPLLTAGPWHDILAPGCCCHAVRRMPIHTILWRPDLTRKGE